MSIEGFPPILEEKKGFYPQDIYEEALRRYPTVAEMVTRKAEESGDKIWLISGEEKYSFKEVDMLTDNLVAGFYEMGMRSGDKIAIFALNSPQWIFSYFAILKLGAIPVTVNTAFIKEPLIYNLKAAEAKYLVLDARLLEAYREVEGELDNIQSLVIIGEHQNEPFSKLHKKYQFLEDLLTVISNPALKAVKLPKDPCAMILTSGTTGRSKVVVDSNAQFITTALFMLDAGGVTGASVVYVYLPLFHIMALDLATISSMLANATMVLVEKFSPTTFWDEVKKHHITHFHAVGPILEMLFKLPPSSLEQEHGSLTAIAYSSKEVWLEAKRRFNLSLTGGYGSTEVGIPISSPYDIVVAGENPPGSCGRVGPHVEARIMDEQGHFLPVGRTGEIVVRPKIPWTIFLEYYGMPQQTVEAFKGLWFHTGDAGYFDGEGYLYFVDRVKDAIRRRGENISSYDVEQLLLKDPQVAEAAVIPAPSEVGEDEVMAVIVPKVGVTISPQDIIDYCVENMPFFWVPRYIRIVGGLPRTPTGRIEKFKLRNESVTADTFDLAGYRSEKRKGFKH